MKNKLYLIFCTTIKLTRTALGLIFIILLLVACQKEKTTEVTDNTGKIVFKFSHYVDGKPLQTDTLKYVNAAGNKYMVNEVKYFISDVTLIRNDGSKKLIDDWTDIYYVDNDINSTLKWQVFDEIEIGNYNSISFTFGINEAKNKSMLFVNPPEVNMAWPGILGGGYHYLMINGRFLDKYNKMQSLIFHLGIGQLYKNDIINTDSIYAFKQNFFTVNLPAAAFTVKKNQTTEIELIMNIEEWFKNPNIFDFDLYGLNTMQDQKAMQMMKENGSDVFSVGYIN
ncbi:MAG: hypothetical protein KA792_02275 [Bacteroidales bacterium]|nr:hypothetical protein [Bacteroidales bacterium]